MFHHLSKISSSWRLQKLLKCTEVFFFPDTQYINLVGRLIPFWRTFYRQTEQQILSRYSFICNWLEWVRKNINLLRSICALLCGWSVYSWEKQQHSLIQNLLTIVKKNCNIRSNWNNRESDMRHCWSQGEPLATHDLFESTCHLWLAYQVWISQHHQTNSFYHNEAYSS